MVSWQLELDWTKAGVARKKGMVNVCNRVGGKGDGGEEGRLGK